MKGFFFYFSKFHLKASRILSELRKVIQAGWELKPVLIQDLVQREVWNGYLEKKIYKHRKIKLFYFQKKVYCENILPATTNTSVSVVIMFNNVEINDRKVSR